MPRNGEWTFPHESLLVYKDACEFLRKVHTRDWPRGFGDLKSQLNRAALSISLNVCEGRAQRMAGNSGLNFYRIALGSAAECHGAIHTFEIVTDLDLHSETTLLRKIGGNLSALIKRS